MSQLALELIRKAKETNAKELDLGKCGLTEIPKELFELTQLETLILSNEYYDVTKRYTIRSKNNSLSNKISNLPDNFKNLKNLTSLKVGGGFSVTRDLNNCHVVKELKNLTSLDLSSNNLTDASFLKELKNLTLLDLSFNKLTDVSFIKELKNLSSLDLMRNNLTDISFLKELKNLTSLDLSDNKLTDVSFLKELKNLTSLDLSSNKLTDVSFIKELKNLTLLQLRNTKLTDVSFIKELKNLTLLNLSNSELTDVSFIKELKNLTSLDLSTNKLTDVSFLTELKNLTLLNLSANKLTNVSFIKELPYLTHLNLEGNLITNPPEDVWKAGLDSIRNYFNELDFAPTEEFLYEAKMVMVGRGEAGKTVLTKKLTNPNFHFNPKEPSTKGINVLKNPFNLKMVGLNNTDTYRFNIWDFGGQTKYDLAHQFFITKKSIYLLLTEARHEDNYLEFENWLNLIKLLGEDSKIIVVVSKIDERKKLYPKDQYMSEFKNIHDFVEISCVDGYEDRITELREKIKEAVMLLPQSNQKLPSTWVEIKKKLETLAKRKDYISYKEYLKICGKYGFDQERADFLSDYLNALGVIIHRQDDMLLKNLVILKIDWGVDVIYKVLDNKEVENQKGFFTDKSLKKVWRSKRYRDKLAELLALMLNYKLAFRCKDESGYIVPILLPPNKPKDVEWDYKDNLRFEYTYYYMPPGIISRFIVEAHHMIFQNNYWRFGVKIYFNNTSALVEEDYIKKRIIIFIDGSDKHGMLSIIRNYFAEVHKKFDRLIYKEWIPCNCEQCMEDKIKGTEPTLYEYNLLINYLIKGIEDIRCPKGRLNSVKVLSLLQNVFAVRKDMNLEDILKSLRQIESKILTQDELRALIDSILTGKEMDKDLGYKISEIIKIKIPLGFADIDLSKFYQKYLHKKELAPLI